MSKNTADIPEKTSEIDKDEGTIDSDGYDLSDIGTVPENSSESQGLGAQKNERELTKNLDNMQAEIDSLKPYC